LSVKAKFFVFGLILAALVLAGVSALAEEDGQETDVVNTNHGNVRQFVSPGDSFVVVQDVTISDAGQYGDNEHDDCDTLIQSITIRKAGGTIDPRYVLQVRLYMDDGDGDFEVLDDALLGAIKQPQIAQDFAEDGLVFSNGEGKLLVLVPNGHERQFYVVADFATEAPHGATLRTSFDAMVGEDLTNGTGCTSEFDPATRLPLLNNDNGVKYTTVAAATGDDETDIIDETLSKDVKLGQSVVLQQLVIADPGPNGDAEGDGHPTLVRSVAVRLSVSEEGDQVLIKRLRLFRESSRTKPGWQEQDELLSTINNPKWEDLLGSGVVFTKGGRLLLRVPDNFRERLYIVADLAIQGFTDENGDGQIHLTASVQVEARDDLIESPQDDSEDGDCFFLCGRSDETSSGIETAQPVDTRGELSIELPAPKVFLSNVEMTRTGKVTISIADLPGEGLGRMSGTFVFDPGLFQVRQTAQGSLKVRALGPYDVLVKTDIEEMKDGYVGFELALKNGTGKRQPITAGPVLEIELEPAIETAELQSVLCQASELNLNSDLEPLALEDKDENPIVSPDIVMGRARLNVLGGDADLNGVVNRKDVRAVSWFILGRLDPSSDLGVDNELFEKAADVAPQFGDVDATDVRHIKEAIAKRRTLPSACDNPIGFLATQHEFSRAIGSQITQTAIEPLRVTSLQARFDRSNQAIEFRAEGRAILGLDLEIYNLSGKQIARKTADGSHLRLALSERETHLANGVYLYRVTVRGHDGTVIRNRLEKLVVAR
jgi:hypothetical protein